MAATALFFMKYKITKMDGRYSRYGFRYLIEFGKSQHGTGVLDFDRSRRWFNEQFGWSQDVETRASMQENQSNYPEVYQANDINPIWGYAVKYGDYRIYVADDKTLSWYLLCHPASQ